MISLDEEDLRELLFPGGHPSLLEEKLAALLGATLSHGEPVHLEGIGVVSLDDQRTIRIAPSPRPRVFLAYVVEDLPQVRAIYRFLKARGFEPWMDVECLLPGQNWPRAIERAIESADFVVPCFSKSPPRSVATFRPNCGWRSNAPTCGPWTKPIWRPRGWSLANCPGPFKSTPNTWTCSPNPLPACGSS